MRIKFLALLISIAIGLLMADCVSQGPTAVTPTEPQKPVTGIQLTSTITSQPIVTHIPTKIPSDLPTYPPSLKITPTPFPKDIFDNFAEVSGFCLVRRAIGAVQSGATVEEPVLSDSTIGRLRFSLSWSGVDLELTLLQPDGTVIDTFKAEENQMDMQFTSKPGYQEYFIRGPQSGTWLARISGEQVPGMSTDYMLDVWVSDATIFSVDFDKDEYISGESMKLTSSIEDSISAAPIAPEYIYGVTMRGVVEDPAQQRFSFSLYDDGNHGDEKVNDGIYANSFSNTQIAGIYKFFFQISGHNNRDNEPFSRECFVVKTINPVPALITTSTSDVLSNVCEESIEASEPVIVRAGSDGGSDLCDTCRYALYPKGVSTNEGILVTWKLGFNGEHPEPNAYMRVLDDNATPTCEVNLLFERNWTGLSSSLVGNGDGAMLTYCGRYPGIDRMTTALLDPFGQLISEHLRSPDDQTCGVWGSGPVWTGSRQLFAWTAGNDVLLDIADVDGNIISRKIILRNGIDNPQLAIGHGHVLMVVTTFTSENPGQTHLSVHRFDLEGNELGETMILDPVTYELGGQIKVGNFKTPYIIPSSSGWLILASSKASGFYVASLTPDGTLITTLDILDKDMYFPNGFEDAIPYEGGAAILGQLFSGEHVILILSPDGKIYQKWYENPSEGSGFGDLLEHKGNLFWIYTSKPTYEKVMINQVLIRKLECIP